MWKAIHAAIHSTLRYRLFALVLMPALLAMLATLGYAIYWFNNFARDNLFLTVKGDLALVRHAIEQGEERYLAKMQGLVDSYQFRTLLARGDARGLQQSLRSLVETDGFAFAHLTGPLGNWLYDGRDGPHRSSKPSPLTARAERGMPGRAFEVFTHDDLLREDAALPRQARLPPAHASDGTGHEADSRALVLRLMYPVSDPQGIVLAVLDAGVLLNRNGGLLDAVRDRVYGAATLPEGGLGVVSLLLDDRRVAANIPAAADGDVLGTRVDEDLRARVLGEGRTALVRDRIGGRWYISAYEPLFDVHGQGVGMLHTGILEAPFRTGYYRSAAVLVLIFLLLIGVSAWAAARGARAVSRPIERMTAVVRATQAGVDRRIGPIDSRDEIGELARQFDAMLDLLRQRNGEIRRAAEELEAKVAARTRELADKNADLETTVGLLKRARRQLMVTEKLAALGELAAGVAHEINNPTAVILGNMEILAAELGSAATPVNREIELIVQQVDRIRHIVNSLLQFARPGAPATAIQEVDVNAVVEETLALVRHVLRGQSVRLIRVLKTRRHVVINTYELQQVLINLIVNAARAMPVAGTLTLSTDDWGEEGVVIGVRDTGTGIAPEALDRIFDPFFTTEPSTRTGLGLSVSYGLIRHYGGSITVESTPGRGSLFCVWLLREPHYGASRAPVPDAAGA